MSHYAETAHQQAPDGRMTLIEHLRELRNRVFFAAVAVVVFSIAAAVFFKRVFAFLIGPYCALPASHRGGETLGGGCRLVAFSVMDQFNVVVKVSLIVGVVASAPFWLFQLWRFITPALHTHEKRRSAIFVGAGSILFGAGAVLSYLVLGRGLEFLLTVAGDNVTTLLDVSGYLRYLITMLAVFGVAFEFPLILITLNAIGMISYVRMKAWWRGMIFGLFAFCAAATPTGDPWTMTALGLAMTALYGVSLLVARLHDARKAAKERREWGDVDGESDDPDAAEDSEGGSDRDYSDIS